MAFPSISPDDCAALKQFLARIEIIDLAYANNTLIDLAIAIRQQNRIKLPDAIIAATAVSHRAILITNDQQLAAVGRQLDELTVSGF